MTSTAVIFIYGSQKDLDEAIKNSKSLPFDEILIAAGGELNFPDPDKMKALPKVRIFKEEQRLGKTVAYNRVIRQIKGSTVFLISGDVRYEPNMPLKLMENLDPDAGMVIPRIIPERNDKLSGRVGNIIWMAHSLYNSVRFESKSFFCGGEFQMLVGTPPAIPENIINDDEYLGNLVFSSGKKIIYRNDLIVKNRVPDNFINLLRQRIRVNYGHMQCLKILGKTSSFSIGFISNLKMSLNILRKLIDGDIVETYTLFLAVLIELTSLVISRMNYLLKVDMTKWKLVSPDAGGLK
ncbi:MAG: glycosyltransferase [Candidatus Thermoplasmatota archaeon]|nr:glycosyltransferase [Candidatus Thermoplasmatota archaeon]